MRRIQELLLAAGLVAAPFAAYANPNARVSDHWKTTELGQVNFRLTSAHLTMADQRWISKVADKAQRDPQALIIVEARASGNRPQKAMRLALHRAQAVREELIDNGVAPERIVMATYADEHAIRPSVRIGATHESIGRVAARYHADATVWSPRLPGGSVTATARR
jgi:outer membrane protein OmpA-like peptidoglycan-associated protein